MNICLRVYWHELQKHNTYIGEENDKSNYLARSVSSIVETTIVPLIFVLERLYKDMLEAYGFRKVTIKTLRKRNSKKSLYEFDISAQK